MCGIADNIVLYYDGIKKKLDKMLELGDIDGEAYDLLKAWMDENAHEVYDYDDDDDYDEYEADGAPTYRVRKYKEQDTACDKCPDLKACAIYGNIIEITTSQDKRKHYMKGLGVICPMTL